MSARPCGGWLFALPTLQEAQMCTCQCLGIKSKLLLGKVVEG